MSNSSQNGQRGNARLKFILVMAILACVAIVGYKFLPVAYQAYTFKDFMQHNVDVAATQGYQAKWVSDQLTKSLPEYGIPQDAVITPSARDNHVEVRVQYTMPIDFPGYLYQYEFDHTAKSTQFITVK
jgi:hypothetical protein